MEIVIEIVGRSGTVMERQRFQQLPLRLGRAYRNDVILSDPFVDPFHCKIDTDEHGELRISDLGSCNGTGIGGRTLRSAGVRLDSGSTLTLGKTHLRILEADQPVPPTLRLSSMEVFFRRASSPWLLLPMLCLLATLLLVEKWLVKPGLFPVEEYSGALIGALALILLYGGFWALIGRIIRHDSRFFGHCMVATVGLLVIHPGELLLQWGAFNLGVLSWLAVLDLLLGGMLILLMLRSSLFLATHLRHWPAHLAALVPALLLVIIGLFHLYSGRLDFRAWPDYSAVLFSPDLQLISPLSEDDFIERSQRIFEISSDD